MQLVYLIYVLSFYQLCLDEQTQPRAVFSEARYFTGGGNANAGVTLWNGETIGIMHVKLFQLYISAHYDFNDIFVTTLTRFRKRTKHHGLVHVRWVYATSLK